MRSLKKIELPLGKKFHRWKVLKNNNKIILCECECGNVKDVLKGNLTSGKTKSCGCLAKELIKKRLSTSASLNPKLYGVYYAMRNRCYNNKNKSYKNYGAKGVIVCEEWLSDYEIFYKWSLEKGYAEGLTIERINYDGNYGPENCKWATRTEQGRNKSNNTLLKLKGETKTLVEWSEIIGVHRETLNRRYRKNWSEEEMFYKPSWKRRDAR